MSGTYESYDCGCSHKKEKGCCPKVPKDCYKFCTPCFSCTFPELYAKVMCCAQKAIAATVNAAAPEAFGTDSYFSIAFGALPSASDPPVPGELTREVAIGRAAVVISAANALRDQLLAYLEKACCCLKADCKYPDDWAKQKDACQKVKDIEAMVDVICCLFESKSAFNAGVFLAAAQIPVGVDPEDAFVTGFAQLSAVTEPLVKDTEAHLAALLRCICGCPTPKKEVHCCPGYKSDH